MMNESVNNYPAVSNSTSDLTISKVGKCKKPFKGMKHVFLATWDI